MRGVQGSVAPPPRVLSSIWTRLNPPFGALLGIVVGGYIYWSGAPVPPAVAWTGFCIYAAWSWSKMKEVVLEGETLTISSCTKRVRVPIRAITDIRTNKWPRASSVAITFDHDIGFGPGIEFLPPFSGAVIWQEEPVAAELRRLVEASRDSSETGI